METADPFDLAESIDLALWAPAADGTSLIGRLAADIAPALPDVDQQLLHRLCAAEFSFFRIEGCHRGAGVDLMNLISGETIWMMDRRLEESARVLGAGRVRTFLSVTLPLSLDGVITGCILVFVITNGSFLTMLLLGGGRITTMSLLIYQQFNTSGDIGFAAAMGNVLMLLALVGLGLQMLLHRRARP